MNYPENPTWHSSADPAEELALAERMHAGMVDASKQTSATFSRDAERSARQNLQIAEERVRRARAAAQVPETAPVPVLEFEAEPEPVAPQKAKRARV